MQHVHGKTAFITGGASGIGLGMAKAFSDAGMKVVMADMSDSNLADAGAQFGRSNREHLLIKLDVTDRHAMARVAEEVEKRFGKIHLLCNNAGLGMAAPISQANYEDWDTMMNVNLGGVINGIVTFLPYLRKHGEGAHIVNTASMAGIIPLPDAGGIYTCSKFAVRGLSESLRLALAAEKIGVSTLFPGLTKTRILDHAKAVAADPGQQLDAVAQAFVNAQINAMDPDELGRVVLESIRRNDAHIIAHSEFGEEMDELHAELMQAIRDDIPAHPERAAFEKDRHMSMRAIKATMESW